MTGAIVAFVIGLLIISLIGLGFMIWAFAGTAKENKQRAFDYGAWWKHEGPWIAGIIIFCLTVVLPGIGWVLEYVITFAISTIP